MALRGSGSRGTWLLAGANGSARPSKCSGGKHKGLVHLIPLSKVKEWYTHGRTWAG